MNISDIGEDFIKQMSQLVEGTLMERKLIPKRNGDQEISAQDLLSFARMCAIELQKSDVQAHSMIEVILSYN